MGMQYELDGSEDGRCVLNAHKYGWVALEVPRYLNCAAVLEA